MRDGQRSAVYAWERTLPQWEDHGSLTLAQCRELVERVWRDYKPGQLAPVIHDGGGFRRATTYGTRDIYLPRWSRSALVVLHETAHALTPGRAPHGPEFATQLLDLMARYAGVDKVAARKAGIEQKPRRVHFSVAKRVSQPKHTGTRCGKHVWRTVAELSRQVTTRGLVVTYAASCRNCGKTIGDVASITAARAA